MTETMYTFGFPIIPCELGQRTANAFDECNNISNQFDWYSFSPEIQRILPMFIQFVQFGSTTAIRGTFKCVRINYV